jgi:hypothetical protein
LATTTGGATGCSLTRSSFPSQSFATSNVPKTTDAGFVGAGFVLEEEEDEEEEE